VLYTCFILRIGLKQASFYWNNKLTAALISFGWVQSEVDKCLFLKFDVSTPPKTTGYIVLFVDDLAVGASPLVLDELATQLAAAFPMKFLGFPSTFTGISVKKLPGGALKLHQAPYIDRMVALWGFGGASVSKAPTTTERLSEVPATPEEKQLMVDKPCRSLVGVCLWLNLTCCKDVGFAVHQTGRRAADPRPPDWTAVKKIFRYLKGTSQLGITFRRVDTHKLSCRFGHIH
jgi:hypothetical protein